MMMTYQLRVLLMAAALIICVMTRAPAQNTNQQLPSGGGTTTEATDPSKKGTKKAAKPKSAASAPKSATTSTKSPTGVAESTAPMDSIEGKWWTAGNDFGRSRVVFKQDGNSISGAILYADGRTGTLSGVLVGKKLNYIWTNSAGDSGAGSLERSWNNFMRGAWRGQTVTNGVWTLIRIEGNWCFGGSRSRIRKVTHGAKGNLRFVTEDGDVEEGHLEDSAIFLDGESGSVKGIMSYKANRIDFATGTYWTWCGR